MLNTLLTLGFLELFELLMYNIKLKKKKNKARTLNSKAVFFWVAGYTAGCAAGMHCDCQFKSLFPSLW